MGAAGWVRSRLQAWFRSAFSWTEPEPKKPEDKSAKRFSIRSHGKFHTMRPHGVKMIVMCGMRKGTGNIWPNNSPVTHNHLRCEWCHTFTPLGEYPGDEWLFISLRVCGNSCCWGKKSCKEEKKKRLCCNVSVSDVSEETQGLCEHVSPPHVTALQDAQLNGIPVHVIHDSYLPDPWAFLLFKPCVALLCLLCSVSYFPTSHPFSFASPSLYL